MLADDGSYDDVNTALVECPALANDGHDYVIEPLPVEYPALADKGAEHNRVTSRRFGAPLRRTAVLARS